VGSQAAERRPLRVRSPAAAESARSLSGSGRAHRLAHRHPFAVWWGVSLLLAILSAILLPTVPSYDPWSWIDWGRELSDPHIGFFLGGGPSWKPLPFLFTALYAPLGAIAPTLWVITARTGGIAGLIGAWRLSALLCHRGGMPAWTEPVAGAFAVAGIVLGASASPWAYYFLRGTSEPLLIGVWVWAIELLFAGRHRSAWALLVAEGLMRPEAWAFLALYGAWLMWRMPALRGWVALGWAAQPVGWFAPPWISTGQPFLAAIHAREYNGQLGPDVLRAVLGRGAGIQPLPSLLLAVVAVAAGLWQLRGGAIAAPRSRRGGRGGAEAPLLIAFAGAWALWWLVVVAETLDGYPGLERFFLPAAAIICVLSGYGLVRLAWAAAGLGGRLLHRFGEVGRSPLAATTVIVVAAASVHFVALRWADARAQEPLAATAVLRIHQLDTSVAALGGRRRILPCRSSVATINHSLQTALAWYLGTTLARVPTVLTAPGVAFVGPHDSIDGEAPPIVLRRDGRPVPWQARLIRTVGAWQLYQVWPVHERRPGCVGD
jgi:hypothetical protein